jgi:hypothetical protein
MKKLFLDDLRSVEMVYPITDLSEWVIVRDFHQFVNYIQKYGLPDYISFDHDLGMEHTKFYFQNGGHESPPDPLTADFKEKTGYDVAKWLVDYCVENGKKLPFFYVHSHNPIGAKNIREFLKNAEKHLNV